MKHALMTADNPTRGLPTVEIVAEEDGNWTRAMPAMRKPRLSHLSREICLPSIPMVGFTHQGQ